MYSRGWWIQPDYVGARSIYASGGTTNGSALVRVIPAERLAVVVLANIGFLLDTVADAVVDEFVPAIRERRKTWTPPPPVTGNADRSNRGSSARGLARLTRIAASDR